MGDRKRGGEGKCIRCVIYNTNCINIHTVYSDNCTRSHIYHTLRKHNVLINKFPTRQYHYYKVRLECEEAVFR